MRLTKGQRRVLVVAWMLVLASTVFPPALFHLANGDQSLWFRPLWQIRLWGGRPTHKGVDWSLLALVWLWIGLGVAAGLWVFRARWRRPARCEACGYSLAGLPGDAACPECGARP